LWLAARADRPQTPIGAAVTEVVRLAHAYARAEQDRVRTWRALVRQRAASGAVAVWGAGAKGVTFCNLVDPECRLLVCVLDVNPAKQGKYIAGTGHRIRAPADLGREGVATVLVLNPNYLTEIAGELTRH